MALPGSGIISFHDIDTELAVSDSNRSLNDSNYRTLAGVSSGQISISSFYGKSNTVMTKITLTGTAGSALDYTLSYSSFSKLPNGYFLYTGYDGNSGQSSIVLYNSSLTVIKQIKITNYGNFTARLLFADNTAIFILLTAASQTYQINGYILRYNMSLVVQASTTLNNPAYVQNGSSASNGCAIVPGISFKDSSGNYYLNLMSYADDTDSSGSYEIAVSTYKYNSSFVLQWAKSIVDGSTGVISPYSFNFSESLGQLFSSFNLAFSRISSSTGAAISNGFGYYYLSGYYGAGISAPLTNGGMAFLEFRGNSTSSTEGYQVTILNSTNTVVSSRIYSFPFSNTIGNFNGGQLGTPRAIISKDGNSLIIIGSYYNTKTYMHVMSISMTTGAVNWSYSITAISTNMISMTDSTMNFPSANNLDNTFSGNFADSHTLQLYVNNTSTGHIISCEILQGDFTKDYSGKGTQGNLVFSSGPTMTVSTPTTPTIYNSSFTTITEATPSTIASLTEATLSPLFTSTVTTI